MWGVQGKQPQDKNISGLASPNVCVVWGKGAAAKCIQQGTCHPPRHAAVKGRAIFPIQFLENPTVKSQRPKLTYSPPSIIMAPARTKLERYQQEWNSSVFVW